MPLALPPLPYPYGALEPTIDELTMRIHHDKHHGGYVAGLNAALEGTAWADRPVEELLGDLDALPEDKRRLVRNNGGGHLNQSLFWESMRPSTTAFRQTRSPGPSRRRSGRSARSGGRSAPPARRAAAAAGRGWSTMAPASLSPPRPTRTRR
jgi:superoxide dismutase